MGKQQEAFVWLSVEAQKALFVDVCHRHTIEACGILLGTRDAHGNWHVEEALPLRNIADSPVYFEFAPEDLLRIDLTYAERVVGVYHSHPTGYARATRRYRGYGVLFKAHLMKYSRDDRMDE